MTIFCLLVDLELDTKPQVGTYLVQWQLLAFWEYFLIMLPTKCVQNVSYSGQTHGPIETVMTQHPPPMFVLA